MTNSDPSFLRGEVVDVDEHHVTLSTARTLTLGVIGMEDDSTFIADMFRQGFEERAEGVYEQERPAQPGIPDTLVPVSAFGDTVPEPGELVEVYEPGEKGVLRAVIVSAEED